MSNLFDQILHTKNIIDFTQTQSFPQNDNNTKQEVAKPQVRGNGDPIDGVLLCKRSTAKAKATTYTSRDGTVVSNTVNPIPGYVPPPPPPAVGPPKPPAVGSTTLTADETSSRKKNTEALMKAIQNGVKLKSVNHKGENHSSGTIAQKNKAQSEVTKAGFMPAAAYIFNASWGNYKEKLTKMVITSGGKEGENKYLNNLMKKHATQEGKAGRTRAVSSDIGSNGKKNKSGSASKGLYEGYVLGRDKKIDRYNNFEQSIDQFLDEYLEKVSKSAEKKGSNLGEKMLKMFSISALVQTPRTFFLENNNLNDQLKKTGCQVQWLTPSDINEAFLDGLINYDNDPNKIAPMLETIFKKQENIFALKLEEIQSARNKHKSNLSKE